MDEDIFPELCLMNAKKTYTKSPKKLIRTTPKSNNVKKVLKPMEKAFDPGEPLTTKVAVEYLLNGKLKSAVCRYCLKISPALSELDLIMQIAGTGSLYKVTIREMIACFYPYKVGQDQNFPDKICQRCLDKAINAYLFTQQCEQSERALLNCFDDMHEKLGKLDPLDRPKKRGRQKLNPNYNTLYAEHEKVMDYAEPIRNIINIQSESLTQEPDWNIFECKKCWQVLPNMESLLNHEKIHPKHMWYHCRLCGKSFLKHNQLKKHHNKVHVLGKDSSLAVDKTFKCNNCGNVSDTYIQHLEHIEKHKFKTIMEHIIQKKTDKLCLVCLNKRTDLVDLDKMICIHGGYPELVGDKTLYTVLASTLPDQKTYKYQELHVPHKANIMTISRKRKRNGKNILNSPNITTNTGIQFDLSLPEIVSNNKFSTDDFYYYALCDPQTDNDMFRIIGSRINTMDTKSPRIVELSDKESMDSNKDCNLHDKILTDAKDAMDVIEKSNTGDTIPSDEKPDNFIGKRNYEIKILTDEHYNVDNKVKEPSIEDTKPYMFNFSNPILMELEDISIKNDDTRTNTSTKLGVDIPVTFTFSYPEYDKTSNDQETYGIKEVLIPEADFKPTKGKSDMSWVFSKVSDKYDLLKDIEVTENIVDVIVQPKIKKYDCNKCWIFQNLNECEYCKNLTKKAVEFTDISNCSSQKENIITSMKKEIDNDNKNVEMHTEFVEIKNDTKERKFDKIWQCSVCLTNNKTDRFTCYCCESNKYIENGNYKVTFGSNKTFHISAKPEESKKEFNVGKGADFTNIGTIPPVIFEEASMMDFKSVNNQDNIEMQIINTAQSMDIETDSVSYQLDTKFTTKDDDMDIEENPSVPYNIVQNFDTLPVNTQTTNTMPYVGTDIQFNIGFTPHGMVQHGKGHRKIKRPVRNIPKVSHK